MLKYLYGILVLLFAACSGSKSLNDGGNTLTGTWLYTEQYTSIGGPGNWSPAQPSGQKITFQTDGNFVSTGEILKGSSRFEILDSLRIKLTPAPNEKGFVVLGYVLDSSGRYLELYPLEPTRCIEGCMSKFQKVAD